MPWLLILLLHHHLHYPQLSRKEIRSCRLHINLSFLSFCDLFLTIFLFLCCWRNGWLIEGLNSTTVLVRQQTSHGTTVRMCTYVGLSEHPYERYYGSTSTRAQYSTFVQLRPQLNTRTRDRGWWCLCFVPQNYNQTMLEKYSRKTINNRSRGE